MYLPTYRYNTRESFKTFRESFTTDGDINKNLICPAFEPSNFVTSSSDNCNVAQRGNIDLWFYNDSSKSKIFLSQIILTNVLAPNSSMTISNPNIPNNPNNPITALSGYTSDVTPTRWGIVTKSTIPATSSFNISPISISNKGATIPSKTNISPGSQSVNGSIPILQCSITVWNVLPTFFPATSSVWFIEQNMSRLITGFGDTGNAQSADLNLSPTTQSSSKISFSFSRAATNPPSTYPSKPFIYGKISMIY